MDILIIFLFAGLILYWQFRSYSVWKHEAIFKHKLTLLYSKVSEANFENVQNKLFLKFAIRKTFKNCYFLTFTGLVLTWILFRKPKHGIAEFVRIQNQIISDGESAPIYHELNNQVLLYLIRQSLLGRLVIPIFAHFKELYKSLTKWGKEVLYAGVLNDDNSNTHFNGGFMHM